MFLRRNYRQRAIGLAGALLVLITGVVATGAMSPAPSVRPAKMAGDCSSSLAERSRCDCHVC